MPKSKLPLATMLAALALIIVFNQTTPVARAYQNGATDRSYPLGFGYCPQPEAHATDAIALMPYDQHSQTMPLIESTTASQSATPWTTDRVSGSDSTINMKNAFQSLQNLKRHDERLAQGNVKLFSLFDTGESALGRQVGADFLVDKVETENKEIPETLAMLLLGTGLIGLARIQRRHLKD